MQLTDIDDYMSNNERWAMICWHFYYSVLYFKIQMQSVISFFKFLPCFMIPKPPWSLLLCKQDQRSQKLTPREQKGTKIRSFKVKTSTQKLKSQYVSSAKQSKTLWINVSGMSQKNFRKISHPKMEISPYLSYFSREVTN